MGRPDVARRAAGSKALPPFDDGVAAVTTGMSKDSNPHPKGSGPYEDWNAGYRSAIDADEATEFDDDPDRRGPYSSR